MHEFNDLFAQILILLAVGIGVTIIANFLKYPYSIALVIVGLLIGLLDLPILDHAKEFITQSTVFQVIIISIFLPTLLGEATLKLPFSHLNENKKPIFALALGGTFFSFLIIGFLSIFLLKLPILVSFTFAALMSATDPISVLSIFKTMGVNKKLTTIIEGESLFNDGIAVVLFTIASGYLLTYMEMGIAGFGSGILLFLKFALGGLIVGVVFGVLASFVIKPIDDYPLEIAISLLLFFGSFFTAEIMHVSGVISVVVSGLIFGNYGSEIGMSSVTKLNINNFWDVIAFIANALIFLMVGLEINNIDFTGKWMIILLGILIVIIARSIAIYASLSFIKEIPLTYKHVLNWGGLKGSLSIALALSLPKDFVGRDEILVLTFSVVLFSLIVQGLTIKPLIHRLGIIEQKQSIIMYEELISNIYRCQRAMMDWDEMNRNSLLSQQEYKELVLGYERKLDDLNEQLDELYLRHPKIKEEQKRDAIRDALYSEYQAVKDLVRREIISERVGEKQMKELMEKIEEIESVKLVY